VVVILFFLLGLPAALLAERLIARLSADDDDIEYTDDESGIMRRLLPWQIGAWPDRLRWATVISIPVLFAIAGLSFEPAEAVVASVILTSLMVCLATDLLTYRVPNVITYPATAVAFSATLLLPDADPESALLAALLGGGVFFGISLVAPRGGFGLGDVKLAVLIGAALGLPAAYQALFFGMLSGGLVILALFLAGVVGRRQAVPYAPFLALAAVAVLLLRGAAFAPG
jgi:leader peptidase (prepilin peptidase)/N-methyltransferase